MKKTTLLLLSTCLLCGCYSTPEMNEVRYSHRMTQNPLGCDSVGSYQNEGLRNCIESRMAYEDANKKTVTIIPTDNGTLVVPKTGDDEDMKDPSRVYEVVEPKSNTQIVIKDEALTEDSAAAAQASETQVVVDENVSANNAGAQVAEDVQVQKAIDAPADTQEVVEIDDVASTDMLDEQGAEYETLNAANDGDDVAQEDESDTHQVTTTTTTTTSPAVEGVTLVVGPLKEDLTISVKTNQSAAKTTTKTRTVKKVKKIEKEVLPLEEK